MLSPRSADALVGLVFVLSGACSQDSAEDGSADAGGVADSAPRSSDAALLADAAPEVCAPMLDVVILIDSSGSMEAKNDLLSEVLPQVLSALRTAGDQVDARLAMTTVHTSHTVLHVVPIEGFPPIERTYVGADGEFLSASCFQDPAWIDLDSPDAETQARCVMKALDELQDVGPYEMPFEALQRATVERVADGTNAGFYRDGAKLLVLAVTDEDDCSTDAAEITVEPEEECASFSLPLEPYIDSLDQFAGGRQSWGWVVVHGGPQGCSVPSIEGYPAPRYTELASQVGDALLTRSVCDSPSTWVEGLEVALERLTGCRS